MRCERRQRLAERVRRRENAPARRRCAVQRGNAMVLQFDPPGPGSWSQDPVHFPRPLTRYWMEIHPVPFRRGTSEFMKLYGTLLEALVCEYVNGFAYTTIVPAPESEVPERFGRAEEAIAKKL